MGEPSSFSFEVQVQSISTWFWLNVQRGFAWVGLGVHEG